MESNGSLALSRGCASGRPRECAVSARRGGLRAQASLSASAWVGTRGNESASRSSLAEVVASGCGLDCGTACVDSPHGSRGVEGGLLPVVMVVLPVVMVVVDDSPAATLAYACSERVGLGGARDCASPSGWVAEEFVALMAAMEWRPGVRGDPPRGAARDRALGDDAGMERSQRAAHGHGAAVAFAGRLSGNACGCPHCGGEEPDGQARYDDNAASLHAVGSPAPRLRAGRGAEGQRGPGDRHDRRWGARALGAPGSLGCAFVLEQSVVVVDVGVESRHAGVVARKE
jgi:hypothetical protein